MYALQPVLAALQAAVPDGEELIFSEVLANVPHDPASIFVYLLLAAAVVGVLWAGRSHPPAGTAPHPPEKVRTGRGR